MKEIKMKVKGVEVNAKVRKLSVDKNYPRQFDPKIDEFEVVNVTGLSDIELHEKMMNDPGYREMFEKFVKEETIKDREKKIKRIIKN
jgi:hypothetical protein